jgi:three-Cys-motif partner protein
VVRKRRLESPTSAFRVLAVERDPELFSALKTNLAPFRDFATLENKPFIEALPIIEDAVKRENVFLYLDPFTVSGLSWVSLDRVFAQINRKQSVEFLLNFNVFALARAACVAVGRRFSDALDDEQMLGESASTLATVNDALGGEWWQAGFKDAQDFEAACRKLTEGYIALLESRFAEVCWHEIRERHAHSIPKYVLVFGSRHPDALKLMNDAMAMSLEHHARAEQPTEALLFETRPTSLVPDDAVLREIILEIASTRQRRGDLILSVIRRVFGQHKRSVVRGSIEALIRERKIVSASGKTRINDDEFVWANP